MKAQRTVLSRRLDRKLMPLASRARRVWVTWADRLVVLGQVLDRTDRVVDEQHQGRSIAVEAGRTAPP